MRSSVRSIACGLVAAALCLAQARPVRASSGGISSAIFGSTGCPLCHYGGTVPVVLLSGPTSVAPDDTVEYTLTIFGNSTQKFGGFNVSASLGTLSTGGGFAANTRTITGPLSTIEITHSSPKPGDFMNVIEFSFQWTAPSAFTSATLRGWGNAVDGSNNPLGDNAALATLDIGVPGSGTPLPTATRTPTPWVCGDVAPLHPALITDRGARACQAAIAKAGSGYVKKAHKIVRKCLKGVLNGGLVGEAIGLCAGSTAAMSPTDPTAAGAIAKAKGKALGILAARCTDADLAGLHACATSEAALEQCFLAQHHQAVLDAVASEYGGAAAVSDVHTQKCQAAIGSAAERFLLAQLGAAHSCLAQTFTAGDGAALCIGALAAGAFVNPTDSATAGAMTAAADKLAAKLLRKCDASESGALNGCGSDPASTVACLLCTHRRTVFGLLANEFGGAP